MRLTGIHLNAPYSSFSTVRMDLMPQIDDPPEHRKTNRSLFRRLPRFPLSAVLSFTFGGLLLLAVSAVFFLAYTSARHNTIKLLTEKSELILNSLSDLRRLYLGPVEEQAQYLEEFIEKHPFETLNEEEKRYLLRMSLAATPQVVDIALISSEGAIVHAFRSPNRSLGDTTALEDKIKIITESSKITEGWGEPFYIEELKANYLPHRKTIYLNGRPIGAIVSILQLSQLSQYLQELSSAEQTLFILYGHDRVLAFPTFTQNPPRLSPDRPLLNTAESDSIPLAAIWREEKQPFRLRSERPMSYEGHVSYLPDNTYIYIYRTLDGYGQPPWIIGAIFKGMETGNEMWLLKWLPASYLALLATAIGIAIWFGRRITQPLRQWIQVADKVRTLDLANIPPLPKSRILELDISANALNSMISALRWFELYIPKRLAHRLIHQSGYASNDAHEREITVMFTDIGGFTGLAERLAPTETAAFLNEHFSMIGKCVNDEEGTIDKYIGDSVMAFWGAPDEQLDHAERACRTAIAIASALTMHNTQRKADGKTALKMRIGIGTGRVLVGNIGAPGRINYTLIGDIVNVAQRLEQLGKEVDPEADIVILLTAGSHACPTGSQATLISEQELRNREATISIYRLI